MNRSSSNNTFQNNSTHQQSHYTNEESREVLLLRCKTTIDDLKDELERTERAKDSLNIKYDTLSKDYKIQERLLEEERILNQGILDELNRVKCQIGLSMNDQKDFKLLLAQKDKKLLEQDMYVKTLCQKITIQDNIIQEYNNELGSKEHECSTLRQGQTESESYWAQSYNMLKISFNQKLAQLKEVEDKNKDISKKVKELEKQIEEIKNSKQMESEAMQDDKVRGEVKRVQKDHNEEVKKIKSESLEAYQQMQEIIKQHEQQQRETSKTNVELKLKIQEMNIEMEKYMQNVPLIQDKLVKKEQEIHHLNNIIKEHEDLMGNFENLLAQKEQQIKEKYYSDLQNVRSQLIELQESNMKTVKDTSKIKEKHQSQLFEREKKIKENIDKLKQMEIKLEKKDQEIKMLHEKIRLIVSKKQKYKKKSIDLNTKYDILDNHIRDIKQKMDQSFVNQENQQPYEYKGNQIVKNQFEVTQQKTLLKNQIGNTKYDLGNHELQQITPTNVKNQNQDNFIKIQDKNPLTQLINNQKGTIRQQQENIIQQYQVKDKDIQQNLRSERSSSSLTGQQSLINIKEKLKASTQNLQKVINKEMSQERPTSHQKSVQNLSSISRVQTQEQVGSNDQTSNQRLIEMKRKMMELQKAVQTKELENNLLKDGIQNKKQKSSFDLTRKTRAFSQNQYY